MFGIEPYGMSKDYRNTAICPHCGAEIGAVTVAQLETVNANTVVKFWTCPDCETVLGPTRFQNPPEE